MHCRTSDMALARVPWAAGCGCPLLPIQGNSSFETEIVLFPKSSPHVGVQIVLSPRCRLHLGLQSSRVFSQWVWRFAGRRCSGPGGCWLIRWQVYYFGLSVFGVYTITEKPN